MSSLGLWPSTILPRSARFMLSTNQRVNASPFGGSEQAIDMLNDRWLCSLALPANNFPTAAAVEAFLFGFRGQINTVDMWHFARPAPLGTVRGAPVLAADAAQGAASVSVTTTAAATLKAGDMIGVGGLLLMVQTDCTADGAGLLLVPLVNRLRVAQVAGTAVGWDKPTAPFRCMSHSGLEFAQGLTDEPTLSMAEVVS